MDGHQDYEHSCAKIREENAELLDRFRSWLDGKGLAGSTIQKHHENVDFYINEYLLYYDAKRASEGVDDVSMFFDDWFVRKALWANRSNMKGMAASLKKFYTFLVEEGIVDQESVQDMKVLIKEEMPDWLESLEGFDDLDMNLNDGWG